MSVEKKTYFTKSIGANSLDFVKNFRYLCQSKNNKEILTFGRNFPTFLIPYCYVLFHKTLFFKKLL